MESNKKNILVFIEWYSPGFRAGGPIRSMENLVSLLSDDYNFYIVTSAFDHTSSRPYSNVEINQWNDGPRGERIYYNGSRRLKPMRVIKSIDVVFDVVYINGVYSRDYSITPTQFFRSHPKLIVAPRGMLAKQSVAIKGLRKNAFLEIAQVLGHFRSVTFHVTSDKEVEEVRQLFPRSAMMQASNVPWLNPPVLSTTKNRGELTVVYFGRISRVKNINFFLDVFNGVVGKAKLIIIGQEDDPSYVSETRQLIQASRQDITVHAASSREQMLELMSDAHAFAVPSLTENYGHSVIEGLSLGLLPLVSDQTPWNDLLDETGFPALPLQAPAWSAALDKMVGLTNEEYQEMSNRVREKALAKVKESTRDLIEHYRALFG